MIPVKNAVTDGINLFNVGRTSSFFTASLWIRAYAIKRLAFFTGEEGQGFLCEHGPSSEKLQDMVKIGTNLDLLKSLPCLFLQELRLKS